MLLNVKIRCNNEKHSKFAQELLFELGYFWSSMKHGAVVKVTKVKYTDRPYLYGYKKGNLSFSGDKNSYGDDIHGNYLRNYFADHQNKEVTIYDLKRALKNKRQNDK